MTPAGFVTDQTELGHRPPLPVEQQQRQAREQHIGRALDRLRHEPRPPALERRPRHDAVLDGKQPEKQGVDDQRRTERPGFAAVDGLGHRQIADEGDGVEERAEEDEIDQATVENSSDTAHGVSPLANVVEHSIRFDA